MPNILDAVREEFFSRLQTNTNWGRNQLTALYTEVERDVLKSLFFNENIVQDISKPSKQLITRKYQIEESDLKPDFEGNPFKSDSDINKGL